jgi:galactarate dehydratase
MNAPVTLPPAAPQRPPLTLRMHPGDNVAIVANDGGLPAGTVLPAGVPGAGLVLGTAVPQGHKVSLTDIPAGAAVTRYAVAIGYAKQAIPAGHWVHERLLDLPAARALEGLPMATVTPAPQPAPAPRTFLGYRNADGSVGTRNLLAVTTTVQCVAGVVDLAVERIRRELLPRFPNVDGVVGLEHTYGCGVAIDAPDADIPIRTLRHISLNPNFGGEVLVVSLGCEKLPPERLLPPGSLPIAADGTAPTGPDTVCLQDGAHVGLMSMLDHIVAKAVPHLERLNARTRVPVPLSELVVGVQCGGSDAFSGVTANPAVGAAADRLVAHGATVMFSENTEVRDAVEQLTARAATPEVAQAVIDQLGWYDRYLERGRSDRAANTTPGNKAGGLSNIVEKAMGSVVKSGTRPISHVLAPGQKLRRDQKGLVYAATPASDFICGTLQLAAGMNLHVFTTGRGTPYGLAACPVIKVATRTDLARRWHDLMDVNAGCIADGECTVDEAGEALFELMIAVASGERTWAERWGLHNALALFNPAPVT